MRLVSGRIFTDSIAAHRTRREPCLVIRPRRTVVSDSVEFARTTVKAGSLIRTDGARMFRVLATEGYRHEYISGYSSPEPGHVTLPGPHRVASLLKRWNAGTHHCRVQREHLQYYLDEFTFRFNRRRSAARCMLSYRLLQQSVNTDPHPLHELISRRLEPASVDTVDLEPLSSNIFEDF